jgi:exodeoxyribonuclease VIII
MGNLVHALALQPISWKKNSASSRKSRKAPSPRRRRSARLSTNTTPGFRLLSADDIKRFLEEYNATLPAQVPLGCIS